VGVRLAMVLRHKCLLIGMTMDRVRVFHEELGELTVADAMAAAASIVKEQSRKPELGEVWLYHEIDETWGDPTLIWSRRPSAATAG